MKQISQYSVEDEPLGRGGMGQVLKGYTPNGLPVAIKEILPEFASDMEYRTRIDKEVSFLKKLTHDGIVRVYDYFSLGENLYIVMELVEGENIEQLVVRDGRMTVERAVDYMIKILQTMQYIHEQGIIHRDIKPSNIMVRPNGSICLLDFGVAKDSSAENTVGGTLIGTVIGTDGYMSPEQAEGMSIDHRSDIYALGCVLFYMLTGNHAYSKFESEVQTKLNIVNTPFPRLTKYVKGLPSFLQDVLDHATDRNMLRRYQSCREFCSELMRLAGVGTQIRTGARSQSLRISIGREGCDLLVFSDNYKVSRHHADVELKEFTGGRFYIYTDCSSNGTLINGQTYTRGMSCNIPYDTPPAIYLAADGNCQLNWNEVRQLLDQRLKEAESSDSQDTGDKEEKTNPHSSYEQPPVHSEEYEEDKRVLSVLFGAVSFLCPLVGLILYCSFKKHKPLRARVCSTWGWIGFCVNLLCGFLAPVIEAICR